MNGVDLCAYVVLYFLRHIGPHRFSQMSTADYAHIFREFIGTSLIKKAPYMYGAFSKYD
jgi:hypothetical protein